MKLIVVESPTKAKTLSRFLGEDYQIEASMGHIKDLPKSKLGVDLEKNFLPDYQVIEGKKKVVAALKKAANGVSGVILATDPDREGEAIARHVQEVLGANNQFSNSNFQRIVFHEITKTAVLGALAHPGKVDLKLVDAQTARRVLDRLVGYKLSPILWKKVRRGLSAGRVQSVAVRLIVEREKEIEAFSAIEYWEIKAHLRATKGEVWFDLVKVNGKKLEVGNKEQADKIVEDLEKAKYRLIEVAEKEVKRYPAPPLITSTLQRSAGNRFGWSAKKTMREAQRLYEEGLITYHRTDSVNLSVVAVEKVRKMIEERYGGEYLPEKAVFYKAKSKMVQGAHEAIRPTGLSTKHEARSTKLGKGAVLLYRLIWDRFVASQMKPAIVKRTIATGEAKTDSLYLFKAKGERLVFDGWSKINEKINLLTVQELPQLTEGEALQLIKLQPEQKFTQPPARFTEASLIKELEQKGIGRPSTYAPIISTILMRQYVEKEERSLKPTVIGLTVTEFLLKHFAGVMDYEFTAKMENNLDRVAEGKVVWVKVVEEFYRPFSERLTKTEENAKRVKIAVEKTGEACPECKQGLPAGRQGEVVVRTGRFGKFLSCSRFPECKYTANFKEVVSGVVCDKCGGQVVVKKTKKGKKFYGCANYPKCDWASWSKPKPNKS
ncbi:MAG: topoisomerase protein [Candidatus Beckwithbacteria bacterium GW2011_GWB1_47_15]|uniref:DNA topoisomerase 1 n=1 Tax=Candidatus Beckwithbacteria bacterium GW2011_GWB1_47_15 TaxID=1618371 RepID=A0A0G1RWH0_9BACT|nr:MAG: topoisomerase I, DNA topoisomerase I protein [Candidatus Beckwithbacteria bacterium GW2011_GWC1_49_16]KKU61471.1 MAG: topoisomerase protein [Candidatus Beckwithbacteria bacterium GW2011_GWB1_47_15]KKU71002.1 MAG: topoisomerase protein [Candidatus Beckwithbacteria bacterium GW2011_GWA2_47_25]KKW03773.1 MAG: topoisomerase protein [Candidatus Beckwithbacteria bacterium GW2011_GWC2_49_11]OGD48823.1 MAG: DNA topoisomerase I [Candidatus Beckwithbacteria bacterium RIFCSPHIGHO2_01_FULL_49_39]O